LDDKVPSIAAARLFLVASSDSGSMVAVLRGGLDSTGATVVEEVVEGIEEDEDEDEEGSEDKEEDLGREEEKEEDDEVVVVVVEGKGTEAGMVGALGNFDDCGSSGSG